MRRASIVFFPSACATSCQIERYTQHPDPLFDALDVCTMEDELPEVATDDTCSIYTRFLSWLTRVFALVLFCGWSKKESMKSCHRFLFRRMNFGQYEDIEQCKKRGTADIAFGVARGAATTFVRWALVDQEINEPAYPRFVLLEACPASLPHSLEYRYGKRIASWIEYVLERITSYSSRDARILSPLAVAYRFPHTIPVAFVTSKRDAVVSFRDTHNLIDVLRLTGHPHVHVLELQDAPHHAYYEKSKRDRHAYKQFVSQMKHLYL